TLLAPRTFVLGYSLPPLPGLKLPRPQRHDPPRPGRHGNGTWIGWSWLATALKNSMPLSFHWFASSTKSASHRAKNTIAPSLSSTRTRKLTFAFPAERDTSIGV